MLRAVQAIVVKDCSAFGIGTSAKPKFIQRREGPFLISQMNLPTDSVDWMGRNNNQMDACPAGALVVVWWAGCQSQSQQSVFIGRTVNED
jgi:hypothetical protein